MHDAGPMTINSRIAVAAATSNATLVARVTSEGGCVVHHDRGLSGRDRVLTTGISLTLLVIAIDRPRASLIFISQFLTSTRTCTIPILLIFGGLSLLALSRHRVRSGVVDVCHGTNCPYVTLSTRANRNLSGLVARLAKGIDILTNGDNINGSALVGHLVPATRLTAKTLSATCSLKARAAAFSRVLRIAVKNI